MPRPRKAGLIMQPIERVLLQEKAETTTQTRKTDRRRIVEIARGETRVMAGQRRARVL